MRYRQNVVIMVWADDAHGLIKWKQQNHFDGRHSDLAFDNPDFELLARSFGAWGRTLTGPGQLPDTLDEAFRQPGPALLAMPVDYGENVKLSQRLGNLTFTGRRRIANTASLASCHRLGCTRSECTAWFKAPQRLSYTRLT